jgi:hypothetical protein
MIEEILRQWNKSDVSVEEILAIKNQLFFREMKDNICVMPGAKEFLRWANPRYRIALATSATPERIPCYDFKAKSSCPGEEILFSDPTLLSGERGRACKGNHHCCAVDALAM